MLRADLSENLHSGLNGASMTALEILFWRNLTDIGCIFVKFVYKYNVNDLMHAKLHVGHHRSRWQIKKQMLTRTPSMYIIYKIII